MFMDTSVNERGSDKPAKYQGATVPKNLHTDSRKDIINLRNQGFQVDDDNDHVEENLSDGSVAVQFEDKPTCNDWGYMYEMETYTLNAVCQT